MEVTKDVALSIEESGGTPVYTYRGVGEVDSSCAQFFDLVDAAAGEADVLYSYALKENGEVWGLDTFGKWLKISAEQEGT